MLRHVKKIVLSKAQHWLVLMCCIYCLSLLNQIMFTKSNFMKMEVTQELRKCANTIEWKEIPCSQMFYCSSGDHTGECWWKLRKLILIVFKTVQNSVRLKKCSIYFPFWFKPICPGDICSSVHFHKACGDIQR